MKQFLTALMLCAAVSLAQADVVSAGQAGFEIRHTVVVDADRADVWRDAIDIGQWWHPDHTISGDAARMTIDSQPLGCFCEHLGDGDGVVHLTVTSVDSNVMLRMSGGLGPLGLMGVAGNMTWEFADTDDGTRVTFTYAVGGYRAGGLGVLAQPVNGVIVEALERLKAYAEGSDPNTDNAE